MENIKRFCYVCKASHRILNTLLFLDEFGEFLIYARGF